nr:hypothetical protein [Tanacetum cinerariifolium]
GEAATCSGCSSAGSISSFAGMNSGYIGSGINFGEVGGGASRGNGGDGIRGSGDDNGESGDGGRVGMAISLAILVSEGSDIGV